MSTTPTADPRQRRGLGRYIQNIRDSYTISRRTYPWIGWGLAAILLAFLALAVVLSLVTSQPLWYWIFLALLISLVGMMALLSWAVRRAQFTQVEGMVGATKIALDQTGRGWYVEDQPVAVQAGGRAMVWRIIGRPGIVLLAEGPQSQTRKLIADQTKIVTRIVPTVPLHVIYVGAEDGQTKLHELNATLRRLPTRPIKLTNEEISQVSKRLASLSNKGLPIPKGIDPNNARPNRRAMRGR